MTDHAERSPSSAVRWMACPGSPEAEKPYPNTSNAYADEGTLAHKLEEVCLRSGKDAEEFVGEVLVDGEVSGEITTEMADYVQKAIDYIRSLTTSTSLLMVEERVQFSEYVLRSFGTADAIIIDGGHVHIVDLKYGMNVVYAEANKQLMLYALGVYQELDCVYGFADFTVHIVQPRKGHYDEFSFDVSEMIEFGERARIASEATYVEGAPRIPSESACQWCRHKANCVELIDHVTEMVKDCFEDVS